MQVCTCLIYHRILTRVLSWQERQVIYQLTQGPYIICQQPW